MGRFFIIFVRKFPIFWSAVNIPRSQYKIILKIKLIEIKVLGGVLLNFKYLSLKYELKTKIVPRKSDKLRSPNMFFPQMVLSKQNTASNSPTAGTPK